MRSCDENVDLLVSGLIGRYYCPEFRSLGDTKRKLAAVLAADIAGYSTLISADEETTVRRLKTIRAIVLPIIEAHGGRTIDLAGDGILVEFASAIRAVEGALAIQRATQSLNGPDDPSMLFRIGVNIGDVIYDEERLYGDGINIAARLETFAEPGGICVSRKVQEEVGDKIVCRFHDLGDQHLKNIPKPVRVFRVYAEGDCTPKAQAAPQVPSDKPSIAVLPFQNMSGDPEQDYFTDGIVEEITTALARFQQLLVIARNSSFTYKGRSVDVKQVGRELGVRYVLEGSVRRAGSRARITGQLIDARSGTHIWADRFDGSIEDVFDLQDQVTSSVVAAIAPKLEQIEIQLALRKPTENLEAYDYYLRGLASAFRNTRDGDDEALRLFYRATEADPNFTVAYGCAAWMFVNKKTNGWMLDSALETAEGVQLGRRAVELGRDDAAALAWGGFSLAYLGFELVEGMACLDRALSLNPNFAGAWYVSGWLQMFFGEHEKAIARLATAMRLSPLDPLIFRMHAGTAYAHFFAGRYEEACTWADKAVWACPSWLTAVRGAAAAHALAGHIEHAQDLGTRIRQVDPEFRLSNLKQLLPLRREEDFAKWSKALAIAGLPT